MKRPGVYLASSSPRRRQLLEQVNISYQVIAPDVDESACEDTDPATYTRRTANLKAAHAKNRIERDLMPARPIVAADTAVVIDEQILGKPDNYDHAYHMLELLSDRTHQVYTSMTILNGEFSESVTRISEVTFCTLGHHDINDYINCGESQGKAGAYAIQGLAAKFISHLSGSYSAVVGLPLFELTQILAKLES